MVVIVGANGSGKSSLVNLLAGLYRPTSGEIFIDNVPTADYIASDLRAATALVPQDDMVFGFSLGENIGIGDPSSLNDLGRVERAANLGGAEAFIRRRGRGFQDALNPFFESRNHANGNAFLEQFDREISSRSAVSGKRRLYDACSDLLTVAGRRRTATLTDVSRLLFLSPLS